MEEMKCANDGTVLVVDGGGVKCPKCGYRERVAVKDQTMVGFMDGSRYDADYFLRGKEKGVSLYENYRWMPELTIPMANAIVRHLRLKTGQQICDFGCARGYLVKALRHLHYTAFGMDASAWAVENADPDVSGFIIHGQAPPACDWVIAKDVLEHVPDVVATVDHLMVAALIGVFAVVPLSVVDDGTYQVLDYEKDVTHIHRLTLPTWVAMFMRPGWEVTASYRVAGVKDNYSSWERGNGFITARRIP